MGSGVTSSMCCERRSCLCADEQRQLWPAASCESRHFSGKACAAPADVARLARSAASQQEAMRRLKPELDAARRIQGRPCPTSQRDPAHFRARRAVDDSGRGVPGNYHADPVLLALYNAVRETTTLGGRFLWIRDISKPDMALAMVVAAITAASMAAGPQSDGPAQQRMVAGSASGVHIGRAVADGIRRRAVLGSVQPRECGPGPYRAARVGSASGLGAAAPRRPRIAVATTVRVRGERSCRGRRRQRAISIAHRSANPGPSPR